MVSDFLADAVALRRHSEELASQFPAVTGDPIVAAAPRSRRRATMASVPAAQHLACDCNLINDLFSYIKQISESQRQNKI